MTDVYDSPRWREIIGDPTRTLTRIVLQICVDGMPVYKRKETLSVKMVQYFMMSLPPWLRYKTQHMLIHMFFPSSFKAKESSKYWDFAAKYEMQDLYTRGVDGSVRVIVFGTSLDTPGRREQLNMQAATAFYPCPHCLHTWQPGLRTQIYGGFRCFLPLNSPWRQRTFLFKGHTYEFRDVETRPTPLLRTDHMVSVMAAIGTTSKPFLGHKGFRLLRLWRGLDWKSSFCDVMHDLKCFTDMVLKGLVGKGSDGMYSGWNKDNNHRNDCKTFGIFQEFWSDPDSLPPWRLSKDAVKIMDNRVLSMWWPHYVDKLAKENHSFWTHR